MDDVDDDWSRKLLPHIHDIVKQREHGGECRKCGKVGTWDFIKSSPCSPVIEKALPAPKETITTLGEKLDEALKNEDSKLALEIVSRMETHEQEESLECQELALQLMEQELELLNAMEQFEQLEALEKLEQEEAELQQALLLSVQPLKKLEQQPVLTRPPATPCQSSTMPPVVGKLIAQQPAECILVFDFSKGTKRVMSYLA